ncbi:MAG: hypothetical protein V9E96_01790 [Chitinophagaceae bacterium]
MDLIIKGISALFLQWKKDVADQIEKLPQSGSDRIYFRIFNSQRNLYSYLQFECSREQNFCNFLSSILYSKDCPCQQCYCINEEQTIYIQKDLGSDSLLNKLEQHGHNDYVYSLFKKSLQALAAIQIKGNDGLNYDVCLTAKEFGKQAILSDLLVL